MSEVYLPRELWCAITSNELDQFILSRVNKDLSSFFDIKLSEQLMVEAVLRGQVEVVKWLRENNCPWSELTTNAAAACGNLELLIWCCMNGCKLGKDACSIAIRGNSDNTIPVLEYLVIKHVPLTAKTFSAAAKRCDVEILQWLGSNNCQVCDNACMKAAGRIPTAEKPASATIETLKWLNENVEDFSEFCCRAAAKSGSLEVLKWLIDNGAPPTDWTISEAIKYGHTDMVEWCINSGITSINACNDAALYGRLELLKWFVDLGLPFNNTTRYNAGQGGHIDVLEWILERDGKLDSRVGDGAAYSGNIETLQWCLNHGCALTALTFQSAATCSDSFSVLKWLREKGCEWNSTACKNAAAKACKESLVWLVENGCPYNKEECLEAARMGKMIDALFGSCNIEKYIEAYKWIRENM